MTAEANDVQGTGWPLAAGEGWRYKKPWQWKGWAMGIAGHACAACHERYVSALSFWGECEVCGAPVCFRCWTQGRRTCLYHGDNAGRQAVPIAEGKTTRKKKRSSRRFFARLLSRGSDEAGIRRCMDAIRSIPLLNYPLSARMVAEKQRVPLPLVVEAFQRTAAGDLWLAMHDDPYREDCFLELS